MFDRPVEAVIFDMDGLLIDSEGIYVAAQQAAARALDREMSLTFCHSIVGVPGPQRNAMIQGLYGASFDLAAFRSHFSANVKRLMEERVPVKAGAVELLDHLDSLRLPRAVATSAARATAEHHLGRAGLLERFAALATRDDVSRPKPHPDVYLEAARRLGVRPEHCIALEDSDAGLTAAHAAGTMAIMVPDIVAPSGEVRAKCLHVAGDLHEVLVLLRGAL